jgi:hypothetical protein
MSYKIVGSKYPGIKPLQLERRLRTGKGVGDVGVGAGVDEG